MVRDPHLADEVTQGAFIVVYLAPTELEDFIGSGFYKYCRS